MASQPVDPTLLPVLSTAHLRVCITPLWLALGLLIAIDAVWLWISPLNLSADSWWALTSFIPLLTLGGWASLRFGDAPRLHLLCRGFTFILTAWPALRLYNHLTMSTGFPFADDGLAAADALLDFDWMQYLLWLDKHPTLILLMDYSYSQLTNYSMVLFMLLMLGREPVQRCEELVVLFFSTAVICSTIGMFFPAKAAAVHYQAPQDLLVHVDAAVGAYHINHLLALRTDAEHLLVLKNLPGLVTFPSFHTAMGVIAIYCARGTLWLLLPSLMVNLLMIASTPLFGSHYFIDIIAGAFVATGAILLHRRYAVSQLHKEVRETPAG